MISNAIQNVEGESDAKISVSISYSTMIEGYVTFSVTDSGVEMTEAVKKNLFKPVAQISPDDLMQGNDSGLGLAICMDIVSLHGGTIGCESPLKVTSVGEESSGGNELFFNIKFEVSVEEDDDDSN